MPEYTAAASARPLVAAKIRDSLLNGIAVALLQPSAGLLDEMAVAAVAFVEETEAVCAVRMAAVVVAADLAETIAAHGIANSHAQTAADHTECLLAEAVSQYTESCHLDTAALVVGHVAAHAGRIVRVVSDLHHEVSSLGAVVSRLAGIQIEGTALSAVVLHVVHDADLVVVDRLADLSVDRLADISADTLDVPAAHLRAVLGLPLTPPPGTTSQEGQEPQTVAYRTQLQYVRTLLVRARTHILAGVLHADPICGSRHHGPRVQRACQRQ